MKRKICVLFLILSLFGVLSLAACEAISSENEKSLSGNYDLVLFTGQSNMVGRESTRYDVEIPEDMAFEYFDRHDEFVPLKNPVGASIGTTIRTSTPTGLKWWEQTPPRT